MLKADELITAATLLEAHVRESWRVYTINFEEGRYTDALKTPLTSPPNPQSAHFMLVAYALENLMKAKIILDSQDKIRNRLFRKLPPYIKTHNHNLTELAKQANVTTTLEEEDLLRRLSRESTWAARYPIPVEDTYLNNVQTYSDGKPYLVALFRPEDTDRLNDLLLRLRKLLPDFPKSS